MALDATIRAAAPFQKHRDKKGKAISIYPQDIREKVRQKKMANVLVFVVDASGSMGANQRMIETKVAVLSLLKDAYIKEISSVNCFRRLCPGHTTPNQEC
ncbi:MAG: hypothetical protein ACLSCV_12375 [Acutalibacteraceae bacterium]